MPCKGWQKYVDESLVGSGYIAKAGIYGLERGERWATSCGLDISTQDAKIVAKGFIETETLRKNGIQLGEKTFTCTKVDHDCIVGRSGYGGNEGCVIFRCRQCMVVALYAEAAHATHCHQLVIKLGDYLKEHGC